jgi:hypothetical protein
MTITQTVDIPSIPQSGTQDRHITIPREVPAGATIITFTPAPKETTVPSDAVSSATKQTKGERDKEIYTRYAEELNKEAMDVLSYQNYFLDAEDSKT